MYLIVIDDIWDEEVWRLIKCAFSKNNLGSQLITTTRIFSVAEACSSSTHDIYRMKPLSDDVSRRLFYNRVFSSGKGCPRESVEVSEHILKKCGGVPLAIITIASLLANNHGTKTKDQWDAALNSIGHGLTQDHSVEDMKKILLFSYYHLPSYLKPCLLYLSVFLEDRKIIRRNLILKWISEGFVYSGEKETSLYELGDSYFNELVNRSMIQPVGIDQEEKVEACLVHDMVLDLICSLASEENFVTVLDGTQKKIPNSQSKVRRLSIQSNKVDVAAISMAKVRSVAAFTNHIFHQLQKISSFEVLRVLDFKYCPILDTGNFLQLRYLLLNGEEVKVLPKEIGKLKFLHVLDIWETSIKELPSSVVQLRCLMCLRIYFGVELPSGINNLTSLEVLEGPLVGKIPSLNINHHLVKELGNLTKLRVLRFTRGDLDESMRRTLVESLSNLHKMETLDIHIGRGCVDLMKEGWVPSRQLCRLSISGCPFPKLPVWIDPSSLPLLSYLSINVSIVRLEDIQLLGMLRALRCLYLGDGIGNFSAEHVVEMSVVTTDAFPCARVGYFGYIETVPSIFPRGAMPRLEYLHFGLPATWIARRDLDLSMGHLPALKLVRVELFCKDASKEEVDEADAALRAAVEDHPNHPKIEISKKNYWEKAKKMRRLHVL